MPEPQDERTTVKKVVLRRPGAGFTPSITDALNGKFQEEQKVEDAREVHKYYTEENLSNPFTQEQFETKWSELLRRYDDRPNLKSILSNTPQLQENYQLLLSVSSSTMDEEIKKIKPDVVSWLRKELQNTQLELITKIEVVQSVKTIYSDSEKLQAMIQKNPELALLRQRFNLDFGN